jgi:hypothetical protein
VGRRAVRGAAATVVGVAVLVSAARAWGFGLEGHEIIEATAYKRLLAQPNVPGAGVSGRLMLASLIQGGVLLPPPCFDLQNARGDCDAAARLEKPLGFWPVLGSGGPDLVLDRQLGQRGQCQHFMAQTLDGLSAVDPRLGVPGALATEAYVRCVRIFGLVFDNILRDPLLASWRVAGTYVLMHAVEDSFSAAHAHRDPSMQVVHLLSWSLIDWTRYLVRGRWSFPAPTHHAVSDDRDHEYLRDGARGPDGRACEDVHQPYAVPEACLSPRALAAVDAISDLLVVIYRLRVHAAAEGRRPSLFASTSGEERATWSAYVHAHVPSAVESAQLPAEPHDPPTRPDLFLGLEGSGGPSALGFGVWGGRLYFKRATIPFALAVVGGGGYRRDQRGESLGTAAGVALMLPLVRRFTISATPAGLRFACDPQFHSCGFDAVATLGTILIPAGSGWFGISGPEWSWTARAMGDRWFALLLGWSRELGPPLAPPRAEAIETWNPPRPDEVHAYRLTRSTRGLYLATTVWSSEANAFIGGGIEWRRDRDRWNRRAGLAPGLQVELQQGSLGGGTRGGGLAAAATLRVYLVHDRVALVLTPALVRFGVLGTPTLGVDVAGRAGLAVEIGNVELGVDSFPLSYLPDGRREMVPLTMHLGVLLD